MFYINITVSVKVIMGVTVLLFNKGSILQYFIIFNTGIRLTITLSNCDVWLMNILVYFNKLKQHTCKKCTL